VRGCACRGCPAPVSLCVCVCVCLCVWVLGQTHHCCPHTPRMPLPPPLPPLPGNFFFAGARSYFGSLESAIFLFRWARQLLCLVERGAATGVPPLAAAASPARVRACACHAPAHIMGVTHHTPIMHEHVSAPNPACTHPPTHTCTHTHTHTHTYTHTHVHPHTHACTHTRAHAHLVLLPAARWRGSPRAPPSCPPSAQRR
jgi:hypothetical protein